MTETGHGQSEFIGESTILITSPFLPAGEKVLKESAKICAYPPLAWISVSFVFYELKHYSCNSRGHKCRDGAAEDCP